MTKIQYKGVEDMVKSIKTNGNYVLPVIVSLVLFFFALASSVLAADIGNCLLCHKYPGISRVDENGNLRLFYVNEDIFNNSVHAKVNCEGCHKDIK